MAPIINGIEFDTSLWPIVRSTPRGLVTDEHYEQMFREYEKLWKKGEKFLSINDTRFSSSGTPRQRQLIGDWMKRSQANIKHYSLGSVVIVDSTIIRGALTAIGWIAQPDIQSIYVKNWEQAVQAVTKLLEAQGLMTDTLRAKLRQVS